MSLYRSLLRAAFPQIRAMSTLSAPAVAPQATAEKQTDDEDQVGIDLKNRNQLQMCVYCEPVWDMSNPYDKERRKCILCEHNIVVDYKNAQLISQFVSRHTGKLYDRHITGLCEKQQERLKQAHKLALIHLLMPSYHKDLKFVKDPKLFDPLRPQRPNPY